MHLSAATTAIILAAVPAGLGCALSSTSKSDVYTSSSPSSSMSSSSFGTSSYSGTSTPTPTAVSSTASSSSSSPSSSFSPPSSSSSSSMPWTTSFSMSTIKSITTDFISTTTTTTSYNMDESTSACPVATSLPTCATACIHSAAIAIGCAQHYDMHHCQCVNFSALSDNAAPCIIGSCGLDKALEAKSVGVTICSACEGVYL